MKRLWVWCVWTTAVAATIPGRYIVELSTEPVATHVAYLGKRGLKSQAAADHRLAIRAEHDRVRAAIEKQPATVLDRMDTVINALVVSVPDSQAASLSKIPGVKRVRQERMFHLVLDHALPLHKVPDAWNIVGLGNAGAGVKIAFIDTGIESSHPGFQDSSLPIPDGFPLVNSPSDVAFTNNKIIVARSYSSLWGTRDPDPSARDRIGHGTATSMAAGGVMIAGPLATISGVAPKAWLGNYKVFGTPGVNDGATESAILKALDDAVSDGMDVVNLSLGSDLAPLPATDPEADAIENASALGVVVVVSAGNNGPDPATVASPGTAPSAIAVGASNNDRVFAASASVNGGGSYVAIPAASAAAPAGPITASIVDVYTLDASGLACGTLPRNSLNGAIAFILRGTCTFEQKLNDAQAAGAVGALIYTDAAQPDAITMAVGAATLPAEMISYADGISLKQNLSNSTSATLDFSLRPAYTSPDGLTDFSAMGPSPDGSIKPDLVAVGANMYTAAETFDPKGALYDPSGFSVYDGTSFSAPLVSGAVALIKAARPGLTVGQYRSLVIDNASPISYIPGTPASVQQAGAGVLNVSAALLSTATIEPASLSFGMGTGTARSTQNLTITNVGTATETYQLAAVPTGSAPVPALPTNSVTLDSGIATTLSLTFPTSGLAPGDYEGFIAVTGATSGVESRVPYWYGVPSNVPAHITVLDTATTLTAGASVQDAVTFHISDGSGIVITNMQPAVSVISGGGALLSVAPRGFSSPGAFGLSVRLGRVPGDNVFRVTVGGISADITLTAQ